MNSSEAARFTAAAVAALDLVRSGGWVTGEVGRREDTPAEVAGSRSVLRRVREDIYGDTKLALYESPELASGAALQEPSGRARTDAAPSQPAGDLETPAAEVDR